VLVATLEVKAASGQTAVVHRSVNVDATAAHRAAVRCEHVGLEHVQRRQRFDADNCGTTSKNPRHRSAGDVSAPFLGASTGL
jgi:hypothetical protein